MEKRAYAVDLLRGLAIVGMVLSGQILWHAELPAWLFHAQVPPPSFRFDPSVPGITWVDLVFPFFLFSMGAAFPLALRKRLEQRGESVALILTVVVRRWALLALFAVALANLRSGVTGTLPGWGSSLLQLAGWGCFCALFMRIRPVFGPAEPHGLSVRRRRHRSPAGGRPVGLGAARLGGAERRHHSGPCKYGALRQPGVALYAEQPAGAPGGAGAAGGPASGQRRRRFVERSVVELVACAVAFPLRLPEIPLYHHSRHDCGRPYL